MKQTFVEYMRENWEELEGNFFKKLKDGTVLKDKLKDKYKGSIGFDFDNKTWLAKPEMSKEIQKFIDNAV